MMEEIPGHPLDLNKLVTLPPSEWIVNPVEGGVLIGAWVYPYGRGVIKRFFKYTVYETVE